MNDGPAPMASTTRCCTFGANKAALPLIAERGYPTGDYDDQVAQLKLP